MKLAFTGTQTGMTEAQAKTVAQWLQTLNPDKIAHTDQVGADFQFHSLVRRVFPNRPIRLYPSTNELTRGHAAGDSYADPAETVVRNRRMIFETNCLIAAPKTIVPDTSVAWHVISYAHLLHRHVIVVLPDGDFSETGQQYRER